jgi:hypothetical protein
MKLIEPEVKMKLLRIIQYNSDKSVTGVEVNDLTLR